VAIPNAAVAATVSPSGGDDTANIQAAIAAVSALTMDAATGLRGASGGTIITMTGNAPFPLAVLAGTGSPVRAGTPTAITDPYVPSGAKTLHVASTAGLTVGTDVRITRPVTASWVHFMGMDALSRCGAPQTWIAAGSDVLTTERTTHGSELSPSR
jgi:hypothetical protein